jgi:sulfite dehydrogenase (cytochrome) subunit B
VRYAIVAAWLCVVAVPAVAQEQAVALKPGPGMETAASTCNICHSLDYIRMNSVFLSPDGWKAEVAKMRGAYGAPIDDATAEAIQHYLATEYGVPPKS